MKTKRFIFYVIFTSMMFTIFTNGGGVSAVFPVTNVTSAPLSIAARAKA